MVPDVVGLVPGRVEVHGSRPGAPAGLPPVRQQAVGAAAGEPPVLEGDPAGPAVRHGRPPGVVPVPVGAPSQELRGAVREPELRGGQRRRRATVGDRGRLGRGARGGGAVVENLITSLWLIRHFEIQLYVQFVT